MINLKTVLHIVRKEFYQIRQDRRMLAVSILAPLIQVFLLGYAATTDITYTDLAVCDMDRTSASRAFVARFTSSSTFVHRWTVDDQRDVDDLVESGRVKAALLIPPGFGDALHGGRQAAVQMIFDGTEANTTSVILGYAGQIVSQYSRQVLLETQPGTGRSVAAVVPVPRVWFNPELRSSHFMVPGVVAMVLMIVTMTLTSLAIVKEKEAGTLEQILVTPIRPVELIMGKLIPFVVIGFVDVVLVLAIARFWFEVPMQGSLILLFSMGFLFILTTLGLGLFISTIARNQQQAMLIAQFFFFLPFIFLSGFTFPISNMPAIIQAVTYLIPLRYFLEIIRGVLLRGAGLGELWPQAAALFLIGIAVFSLSTLRFRRRLE